MGGVVAVGVPKAVAVREGRARLRSAVLPPRLRKLINVSWVYERQLCDSPGPISGRRPSGLNFSQAHYSLGWAHLGINLLSHTQCRGRRKTAPPALALARA